MLKIKATGRKLPIKVIKEYKVVKEYKDNKVIKDNKYSYLLNTK